MNSTNILLLGHSVVPPNELSQKVDHGLPFGPCSRDMLSSHPHPNRDEPHGRRLNQGQHNLLREENSRKCLGFSTEINCYCCFFNLRKLVRLGTLMTGRVEVLVQRFFS